MKDIQLTQEDYEYILSMLKSEGWKRLEAVMKADLENMTTRMIALDDHQESQTLKFRVRAITWLLTYPYKEVDKALEATKDQPPGNDAAE